MKKNYSFGFLPLLISIFLNQNLFAMEIATKADLKYLSENSSEWSNSHQQTADIIFNDADFELGGDFYNGGLGFSPIGMGSRFTGFYEGQGFKIENLYINRPLESSVGLFSSVYISYPIGAGPYLITGINLVNCEIYGNNFVGGIAGANHSYIDNCSVSGSVSGTRYVGGVSGECLDLDYANNNFVMRAGKIRNSFSTAAIVGTGYYVGGLVGWAYNRIEGCYATGNVSGVQYVGGLLGFGGEGWGNIHNSYATGNVSGTNIIGGLAGGFDFGGGALNSFSTGLVSGTGFSVRGLIGSADPSNTINCFWDLETSGQAISECGTGKTNAEMRNQSTFTDAGWDFSTIWKMSEACPNNGYPIFTSQATQNPSSTVVLNDRKINIAYTLPALSSGDYYTGENASGTMKFAGNVLTSSQTVYLLDAESCSQKQFDLKIMTSLISQDFERSLVSTYDVVHPRQIPGAINYKYRVSDGVSTWEYTGTPGVWACNLGHVSSEITYGKTYQMNVSYTSDGSSWSPYGKVGEVKTLTRLKEWYCNQTLPSINTWLGTYEVANAVNYRYEIFDGVQTITYTRGIADIGLNLSWIPGIQLNKIYQIRVATTLDNITWSSYGAACQVTTPATGLIKNDNDVDFYTNTILETYPNPTTGDFTISCTHDGLFSVINELGQVMRTIEITKENNFQTKIENLVKGIYFITGNVNDEIVVNKIVVQ